MRSLLYCAKYLFTDTWNAMGKPAGVRCVQLNDDNLCKLFGKPERPKVCHDFKPCPVVCGKTNQEALDNITELEQLT